MKQFFLTLALLLSPVICNAQITINIRYKAENNR